MKFSSINFPKKFFHLKLRFEKKIRGKNSKSNEKCKKDWFFLGDPDFVF